MSKNNEILSQHIKRYKEESIDCLNRALEVIDLFDKSGDREESVNELLRIIHSLKGNSSLLGFREIRKICHSCETVLSICRDDISKYNRKDVVIIREALDFMKNSIVGFSARQTVVDEKTAEYFLKKIKVQLDTGDQDSKQLLVEILRGADKDELNEHKSQKVIALLVDLKDIVTDETKSFIEDAIKIYNESVPIDGFTPFLSEIILDRVCKTETKPIGTVSGTDGLSEGQIDEVSDIIQKSIRVDEENLDNLLSQVSDLVITNEVYSHIHKRLELTSEANSDILSLKKNNEALSGIVRKIQLELSQIRKVSLKQLASKARQIVKEMSRERGKEINLVIEGEDLFIDKSLSDALQDPFIHLIRNAADHGIENADKRISNDKSEKGNINITFSEDSDNFYLVVEDDGKGVDPDEIVRKAIKKGMLTSEASVTLTRQQKIDLLTLPGFSTVDTANEFSGRGVGFDVVKRNVSGINGTLDIESEMKKYMRVKITLPKNVFIKIINGFLF